MVRLAVLLPTHATVLEILVVILLRQYKRSWLDQSEILYDVLLEVPLFIVSFSTWACFPVRARVLYVLPWYF